VNFAFGKDGAEGVAPETEKMKIRLVATDGRRLATAAFAWEGADERTAAFTLPLRSVPELLHILGDTGDVSISFNERNVSFAAQVADDKTGLVDDILLVSKVVESLFPNYKQVIPKSAANRITIQRQELLDAILAVALIAEKNSMLSFGISGAKLDISASSQELGDASDSVAIKGYDAEPISLQFDPKYLVDPLQSLTDDEVHVEFKDDQSPAVIKDSSDFLCLVMPRRGN